MSSEPFVEWSNYGKLRLDFAAFGELGRRMASAVVAAVSSEVDLWVHYEPGVAAQRSIFSRDDMLFVAIGDEAGALQRGRAMLARRRSEEPLVIVVAPAGARDALMPHTDSFMELGTGAGGERRAVAGIVALSEAAVVETMPAIDLADIRTMLIGNGPVAVGVGKASGRDQAVEATQRAIEDLASQGVSIASAPGFIVYMASGLPDDLYDCERAVEVLSLWIGDKSTVVMGQNMVPMPALEGMRVTILAVDVAEYASVSSWSAR